MNLLLPSAINLSQQWANHSDKAGPRAKYKFGIFYWFSTRGETTPMTLNSPVAKKATNTENEMKKFHNSRMQIP